MDELFKTHKDVPYGWLLALQQALTLSRRRRARRAGACEAPFAALPGGLNHLSGPH
ncbi:hypothetical protein [Phenylobacterium sp.]|uniref:hypothetical protein n=1 Tax=Phenylobacterium sp. TaxID=1871053 RepID=UPI002C55D124|nr:hypothetical protein [Phenylobacterium sp.]HVI33106.1 hypothetical protein [Phenylobacterium sp.]